jgi:hypothetical protein
MKAKWEVFLTLGGLFVLLMLAKPHLDARPPAQSGDWVLDTLRAAQGQTISGPSLIVAVAIVAAYGWWSITQEKRLNGCMGPMASAGLGALALWALFMLGGGA